MKVIVGMATTNKRRKYAIEAMNSLAPQVDEIRLYDNDAELHDYTDNAKFYYLSHYKEPVYWFSCDDDLIFPPTYVKDMINKIEEHKCIVTHHGRRLRGLSLDYYTGHYGYRCLSFNPADYPISVAGTGCTAFRTDYFNPVEIYRSEDKKMADLVFSLEAKKQNKKIVVLSHREGYIKQLPVPSELTIYHDQKNKAVRQMELANEIYLHESI